VAKAKQVKCPRFAESPATAGQLRLARVEQLDQLVPKKESDRRAKFFPISGGGRLDFLIPAQSWQALKVSQLTKIVHNATVGKQIH